MSKHRDLFLIRAYTFLVVGGSGFIAPFFSLFYQEQGLSGMEIGWLGTVWSAVALVAAPIWGRWSDLSPRPRRLLQFGLFGSALLFLLLSQQRLFWVMAVILGVEAMLSAGGEPLSNRQVMAITQGNDKAGFGSVRLWGSLGWALLAPLAGWIIERTSLFSGFAGYAIFMLLGVVLLSFITTDTNSARGESSELHLPIREILRGLLKDRALVGLAVAIVVTVLSMNGIHRFEAIYLKRLDAPESIIGLVNTVGALVELPAMFLADRLNRKFGTGRVLKAGFLLTALSMVFVLASPSVATIFFMRFLNGVGYGLYIVASIQFVVEHSPVEQQATLLAILTVTLTCITQMVAGPFSGWVFDTAGPYWLYAVGLVGNLLCWVAIWVTGKKRAVTEIG